jgi:nucleoid-associated protein EbfC
MSSGTPETGDEKPKMPSFSKIMEEAQKIQQKMKWAQAELASNTVQGKAGDVTVTIDGRYQVKEVKIGTGSYSAGIDVLQELVAAAVADALGKIALLYQSQMGRLTKDLGIPPDTSVEKISELYAEDDAKK